MRQAIALTILLAPASLAAQASSTPPLAESVATQTTPAASSSRVYSGTANRLAVAIPRAPESSVLTMDGNLDEPVWQTAALLTGFSEYQPQDGLPAEDSTEVYVWYADHAIYFGIRAFEPHGPARANRADRDKITADDHIQIFLDTFNDRRRALVFMVNPFGNQSDGTRSETGTSGGSNDLNEDFQYQSKGRVTDFGYEVEIRIPFKSLRYQSVPVQDWGFNVLREVQHSQHEQSWAPIKKGNASMLVQSGKLKGISNIKRGLVFDINPTVTSFVNGAPAAPPAGGGWDYAVPKPEFGGNAVWGITPNLTMNATANPDFSQVEADVQQNQFDPRSAVSFPEKRPFFLEGSQQFDAPNNLIYTRSIGQPVAALKLNGKQSGISVGLLSAVDESQFSTITATATNPDRPNPIYNILRLKRDMGAQSTAGLVYTDRIDGTNWNRVIGGDARYVFSKVWFLYGTYAQSFDKTGTAAKTQGRRWNMQLDRTGKFWGNSFTFNGIDSLFRTRSGFANRANQVNASIAQRFSFFGKPKAMLEQWQFTVSLSGNWGYNHFFKGGRQDSIWGIKGTHLPNDPKLHFNNTINLKGGWRITANYFLESFHYDPALYNSYYIERTLAGGLKDTIRYVGVNRITNHDYSLSLQTPQWKTLRLSFNVIGGWDENFEEWAPAYVNFPTLTVDWTPTGRLRVNARYPLTLYYRLTDNSLVKWRQIPRLKVEYQASRAIFFRFVGQYDVQYRDSLRDDSRTGFPILLRTGNTYSRNTLFKRNDLRVDWLFSYQPRPGTVFFVGYGAGYRASQIPPYPDGFTDLTRQTDGFFVKLSYLYRL